METIRYCLDCGWCRVYVDVDRGSNYFCDKRHEPLVVDMIGRQACKDFVSYGQVGGGKPSPSASLPRHRRRRRHGAA